jgi:multiple sugar transport system ATP-binding protein
VFLLDEPLASLDLALRTELKTEIASLVRSLGITTLLVTHDQSEALSMADRIAILRDGALEDVGKPQEIYTDPHTAFVAAFLSTPQINLLHGTLHATSEKEVVVNLGGQALRIPPTDHRAEYLAKRSGENVVVGLRTDALHLTSGYTAGATLIGQIRRIEYHGYEWLVHLETGIAPVDVDTLGTRTRRGLPRAQKNRPAYRVTSSRADLLPDVDGRSDTSRQHHGNRRRADIAIRMESTRGWKKGDAVNVAIDLSQLYFFGEDGTRIDPVTR